MYNIRNCSQRLSNFEQLMMIFQPNYLFLILALSTIHAADERQQYSCILNKEFKTKTSSIYMKKFSAKLNSWSIWIVQLSCTAKKRKIQQ